MNEFLASIFNDGEANLLLWSSLLKRALRQYVDGQIADRRNVDFQFITIKNTTNILLVSSTHENVFPGLVSNCYLKLGCYVNRHQS
jgi:hypothetical protein